MATFSFANQNRPFCLRKLFFNSSRYVIDNYIINISRFAGVNARRRYWFDGNSTQRTGEFY